MSWIDTAVVTGVVIGGIFIFYRALKEPADILFGMIGKGIKGIFGKLSNAGESGAGAYEEIRYG